MTNLPELNEELFDIGAALYLLLRRYNSMEKRLIVDVLTELISREFRRNESD